MPTRGGARGYRVVAGITTQGVVLGGARHRDGFHPCPSWHRGAGFTKQLRGETAAKIRLQRTTEIESDLRELLAQIAHLTAARRTVKNIEHLHQARIKLAEVCAAYDNEFTDLQLSIDVITHPADRLNTRFQLYRAQATAERELEEQIGMEL